MDEVTAKVSDMYSRFPYPSPQAAGRKLKELYNLLKIFKWKRVTISRARPSWTPAPAPAIV